jgi:hypothetical protein
MASKETAAKLLFLLMSKRIPVLRIHFALTDQSTRDYGTAIASFAKNKAGKWSFNKYYFEPELKGGNFGAERCVQQ